MRTTLIHELPWQMVPAGTTLGVALSQDAIEHMLHFEQAMGPSGMELLRGVNGTDTVLFYEGLPDAYVKVHKLEGARLPFVGKANDFIPGLGHGGHYCPATPKHGIFPLSVKVHTPTDV